MIFFIALLCAFNILSWIVFLRKFKNLFTIDDVISEAKSEINKIVTDLNNNASRDITILDDKHSMLEAVIKEADKRIRILMDLEKQNAGVARLSEKVSASRNNSAAKRAANAYGKNKTSSKSSKYNEADADLRSLAITQSGREEIASQGTLFDSPINNAATMDALDNGSSYAEVPVVHADAFYPDVPALEGSGRDTKSVLKARIVSLFHSGLTIEEIARELSCAITEVQLVLSLADLM